VIALAASPSGASAAANPCPAQTHYDWMGSAEAEAATIPSLAHPFGNGSYDGTVVGPTDRAAFPGPRPVVLIQHGLGGNQCANWWTAQDLAGHGYIAVVWTAPQGSSPTDAFVNALDAMRSAIAFVPTAGNPYAGRSDASRMALAGHSLGSIVASVAQGDPNPGVKAVVALDTLRRWANGDPGGAVFECAAAQALEVTPRVPALGFAKDEPCNAKPDYAPVDLKLAGFEHWRAAGIPAMELVMNGYAHLDFATPGSEARHRRLSYFIEAWLDRWLLGDPSADRRLLAGTVLGQPTTNLMSTKFASAAYLPPAVDTVDYRSWLGEPARPQTRKLHGPKRHVSRKRARKGLRFRFDSRDPAAYFECRLDRARFAECESPRRIERVGPGRHRFRVRAVDPRGPVEASPARWRFRVER